MFPLGGAGSLALGVWALRRGGMPADEIARKTAAFFLLTSAPSVAMLFLLGAGLATGILPGGGGLLLTALLAVVAAAAIAATLVLRGLALRARARVMRQGEGSRWVRLAPALPATSDGIEEAVHQLRRETQAIKFCKPRRHHRDRGPRPRDHRSAPCQSTRRAGFGTGRLGCRLRSFRIMSAQPEPGECVSEDAQNVYARTTRHLRVFIGLPTALLLACVAHTVTDGLTAGLALGMVLTAPLLLAALRLWRIGSRRRPDDTVPPGMER